jgi:hypothetical protein
MAIASRLGPWLIGTVKETTGATAGTIRNMGATHSLQSRNIVFGDTTANTVLAVIPAGSYIQQVQLLITTAYTTNNPTITIFVNGNAVTQAITVASPAVGATGIANFALGTSNPALVANVGTTDAVISFTQTVTTTTGAGVLSISYIVRNPDGTYGVNA